jgi:RNA polymerase sigma-70 factor (ECF subfamily)
MRPELVPSRPAAPPPEWLAGCRAGDPEAIRRMFEDMLPVVERVMQRVVGPGADLEDLAQITFTETLRALPRFRGDASFKTWITSIAVHVAQHHLRAGRHRRHVALELVPEERIASAPGEPEARLDERRMGRRLYQLLDQISPPKRVALLLFAVEGRPVEEVAALMGASQTATRSRVFFARRELRRLIAADAQLTELASALLGGLPAAGREAERP